MSPAPNSCPYIQYDTKKNIVLLKSPSIGDTIQIKNSNILKLGSTTNALLELKQIEQQIQGMSALPDFGYGEDNYILDCLSNQDKDLTALIGSSEKFTWLMNYIKLQTLSREAKNHQVRLQEEKKKRAAFRKIAVGDAQMEASPLE